MLTRILALTTVIWQWPRLPGGDLHLLRRPPPVRRIHHAEIDNQQAIPVNDAMNKATATVLCPSR
ncbi:hypothetical protein ACBJ59_61750 [Nonomuraea sp. MTCD27]|uniref:hypothetical protein n=1 Tax=Nonomuraea sp. MTCD27 TaxID=1676747 RepID=UPI0035BFAA19